MGKDVMSRNSLHLCTLYWAFIDDWEAVSGVWLARSAACLPLSCAVQDKWKYRAPFLMISFRITTQYSTCTVTAVHRVQLGPCHLTCNTSRWANNWSDMLPRSVLIFPTHSADVMSRTPKSKNNPISHTQGVKSVFPELSISRPDLAQLSSV